MSKASDSNMGYDGWARLAHWLAALVILGLIGLGWWMVGLSYYDTYYHQSLSWHKAIGMFALVLGLVVVVRKAFGKTPPPLATLSRFDRIASKSVHGFLLVLMLAMPVSGYLVSTSAGDGIDIFGLMTVPALIRVSDVVRDSMIQVHFWLAYGGLALIALHAAAAIKHHVVDKDRTLMRMLTGR